MVSVNEVVLDSLIVSSGHLSNVPDGCINPWEAALILKYYVSGSEGKIRKE